MNFGSPEAREKFVTSITCSICLEIYNSEQKPVSLGCGHSVCRVCVQEIDKCPFDRKSFTINTSNMPFNFDLLQMAELYNEQSTSEAARPSVVRLIDSKSTANRASAPPAPSAPPALSAPVTAVPLAATTARVTVVTQPQPAVLESSKTSAIVNSTSDRRIHLIRSSESEQYGFELGVIESKNWYILGKISPESIAYRLGLRNDDRVVEINGTVLSTDAKKKDVIKLLAQSKKQLNLVVSRNHGATYNDTIPKPKIVYKALEIKPRQLGYGMTIEIKGKMFVITNVESNSPAKQAGVKLYDVVHEVNGIDVVGMSFEKLTDLIHSSTHFLILGVRETKK